MSLFKTKQNKQKTKQKEIKEKKRRKIALCGKGHAGKARARATSPEHAGRMGARAASPEHAGIWTPAHLQRLHFPQFPPLLPHPLPTRRLEESLSKDDCGTGDAVVLCRSPTLWRVESAKGESSQDEEVGKQRGGRETGGPTDWRGRCWWRTRGEWSGRLCGR